MCQRKTGDARISSKEITSIAKNLSYCKGNGSSQRLNWTDCGETIVEHEGILDQFDAMWISSLCDSTAKGKPDIELVDITSRCRTIDDVMEVTTKPIIFDGDTGGLTEHFVYLVRTLERMGVSAIIIEDKTGLKKILCLEQTLYKHKTLLKILVLKSLLEKKHS